MLGLASPYYFSSLSKLLPYVRFYLIDGLEVFSKDQRTIRRWCEKGLVPGAYRTKGGHWRIRAKKYYLIKPRIDGFARDRKGQWKSGKELARLLRRPYFKAAISAVDELLQGEQLAAQVELDEIASASWQAADKAPSIENYEHIKRLAVTLWARRAVEYGRPSMAAIARSSGLPRTTFIRYFSQYVTEELFERVYDSFKSFDPVAEEMESQGVIYYDERDEKDESPWNERVRVEWFDYDEIDRRNGWKKP
jgi:hypothetical protein